MCTRRAEPATPPVSRLALGNQVREGEYAVGAGDTPVLLTHGEFCTLVVLVLARLTTETGLTDLASVANGKNAVHQAVRRLRAAFDRTLDSRSGKQLIVSAGRGEYYLDIPADHITVDPAIAELAPNHLAHSVADALLAATRARALSARRQ
jgi:hypothetical protein